MIIFKFLEKLSAVLILTVVPVFTQKQDSFIFWINFGEFFFDNNFMSERN